VVDPRLAGQIWIKGETKVRLFSTPEAAINAALKAEAGGKTVRVVYVHDRESGNKLFSERAWYVRTGEELNAFLSKASADDWAAKHNGKEMSYADVRTALGAGVAKND
jgi:NitT/TauT family transport system substrate-binding protein